MILDFKDKSGRVVISGDYIIYGHALGRCAGLRYGKVLAVVEELKWKATKAPKLKLKVHGVNDDWSHKGAHLLQRPSYLQFSERVLVISKEQVPLRILELFKEIEK